MKNQVIVKPLGGLANRLRVIESAISLATSLNQPLKIVWVIDRFMGASFEQLFKLPQNVSVINHDQYKYVRTSFSLQGIKQTFSKLINRIYGIDIAFNESDFALIIWPNNYSLTDLCWNKTSYFYTCQQFYNFTYKYSWLLPVPPIQAILDNFSKTIFNTKCIGIHIRRTDHTISIEQSPDEVFEMAISREINKNNDIVFFLATDDAETEKKFLSKYGSNRILVHNKMFSRESLKGTQDAMVDLLSLARCQKIYGSYWSSFSETASLISGVETIILKK